MRTPSTCRRLRAVAALPEASPYRLQYYVRGGSPFAEHTFQACRRLRVVAALPEASPYRLQYYVHGGSPFAENTFQVVSSTFGMDSAGAFRSPTHAVLPRLFPRVMCVEATDTGHTPQKNRAAARLWQHLAAIHTLTELDVRSCAWATWFRPWSQWANVHPLQGETLPPDDCRYNEDAVARFSSLGAHLPRLSVLRLGTVCAHPKLSFSNFRALTELEAEWVEARLVREFPTSLTSLSISRLLATSPTVFRSLKEAQEDLADAFSHLLPNLRVLNLPDQEPSVGLALTLLSRSPGLDKLRCSSNPVERKGGAQRDETEAARRDASLLLELNNVQRLAGVRDLDVGPVKHAGALLNLLTTPNKRIECLSVSAYYIVMTLVVPHKPIERDTKIVATTEADAGSRDVIAALVETRAGPLFPCLREFRFKAHLLTCGAVLAQLARSHTDAPLLATLRLAIYIEEDDEREGGCATQLAPLGSLPHLSTLALRLQFSPNFHRSTPHVLRLPVMTSLTELDFSPNAEVTHALRPKVSPNLHTLRLREHAIANFRAHTVPSVVVLDLSIQSFCGVLGMQDELLKLSALRHLVMNNDTRSHVFNGTFDLLRARSVTLTFKDAPSI